MALFAWRALSALGMRLPPGARIADPSVGEGSFLRAAFASGAAPPGTEAVGVDLDPAVAPSWPGGWRTALGDGLLDHPDAGLVEGTFDAVAGNPPFGGQGLDALAGLSVPGRDGGAPDPGAEALARALLSRYRLWREGRRPTDVDFGPGPGPSPAAAALLARLRRFPVEVLFLERFVALLRPGGHLACVLPDGVLANAESRRWRDALLDRVELRAVVALPDGTFARTGASARTALVLARRRAPGDGPRRPAWMAAPEPGEALEPYLAGVLDALDGGRGA